MKNNGLSAIELLNFLRRDIQIHINQCKELKRESYNIPVSTLQLYEIAIREIIERLPIDPNDGLIKNIDKLIKEK